MLFATPKLEKVERDVLERINKTRAELRFMLAEGRRWRGVLARQFLARAIQGSNSIEGINFSVDDAMAAIAKEPGDARSGNAHELYGFQSAMTFILNLADDPHFVYHEGFIRSVHFMMTSYDTERHPGRWRSGPIFVKREETGEIVYEGAPAEAVPELMTEFMEQLEKGKSSDVPPLVQAAMAHLNLVMIHPFSDGNGRMSRALQTLVIVRDRVLDPQFCSIEEYIGRLARQKYYDTLQAVGGKTWNPKGDARQFVRFCLTAHFNQAYRLHRHALRMGTIWLDADKAIKEAGLPERLAFAVADAAFLFEVHNATYRQSAGVDEKRATKDLKLLVDHGMLIPSGERRGRSYKGGPQVEKIRKHARDKYPPKPPVDPFTSDASADW